MKWALTMILSGITTVVFAGSISITSPPATIVVEKKAPPSVRFAGGELQSYLQKITGKKFNIASVPVAKAANIFLGKSKYSAQAKIDTRKLSAYGYIITVVNGNLYILGNDSTDKAGEQLFELRKNLDGQLSDTNEYSLDHWDFDMGTAVGVWRFLEKIGVRWLFPGTLGESIPSHESIALPDSFEIQKAPHFISRVIYGNRWLKKDEPSSIWHYIYPEEGEQLHWSGNNNMLWILRQGGATKFLAMNHRPNRHAWDGRFGSKHPEYFALRDDGKRNIPSQTHLPRYSLCYSSLGMFHESMEDIDAFFRGEKPQTRGIFYHKSSSNNNGWLAEAAYKDTFSLLPHDTYAPCVCKECQKYIDYSKPFPKQLSNLIWGFVKKIGDANIKKFPHKYFINLAYSAYSLPPDNIEKLPDNIIVGLCMYHANNIVSAANPDYMKNLLALSDEWMAYTNNPPAYWLHFLYRWNRKPRKYIPMLFPRHLGAFFKEIAKRSKNLKIEVDRNSRMYELINRYVLYKLMWDPQLDAGKVSDDFIFHYFGADAFPLMKKLLGDVEQNCTKIASSNASNYDVYKNYFNRENIDCYQKQMADAMKIIVDPIQLQRARLFQKFFFGAMELGLNDFEKSFSGSQKSNIIISTETKNKLKMDGNFDEPDWQNIPNWDFYQNITAQRIKFANVKLLYDENDLYFAFTLNGPNRERYALSHQFGNVEICLDSNNDEDSYYKIQLTSDNKMRDMFYQGGGEPPHEAWNSHAKYAVKLLPNGWQAEIAVPRKQLKLNPKKSLEKCRINLCYNMAAPEGRAQHSSTSSIMIGDFNQPGLFSTLAFAKNKSLDNLLKNPSFENGKDNKVVGWNSPSTCKRMEMKQAPDGNAVMCLIKGEQQSLCDTLSNKMPVKPEVFFEFTGKHQGSNGSIYVLFYDKNGKLLPNTTVTTYANSSSIWHSFKLSGVIPPGTVNAAILLRSWSTSKQLLFDDLKFMSEK